MARFKIKSTLENICSSIWANPNVHEGKTILKEYIESKNINEIDKKIMLQNLELIKSKPKLDLYVANSLLKFEGLGVK